MLDKFGNVFGTKQIYKEIAKGMNEHEIIELIENKCDEMLTENKLNLIKEIRDSVLNEYKKKIEEVLKEKNIQSYTRASEKSDLKHNLGHEDVKSLIEKILVDKLIKLDSALNIELQKLLLKKYYVTKSSLKNDLINLLKKPNDDFAAVLKQLLK